MVDGALARASAFRVGLGVGGVVISPGFLVCPSRSCDGWVCGLGEVVDSLVFGLVRGDGTFAAVFPSFPLVSRMPLAQHKRVSGHFFSAASSSRRETMVGGTLVHAFFSALHRASAYPKSKEAPVFPLQGLLQLPQDLYV